VVGQGPRTELISTASDTMEMNVDHIIRIGESGSVNYATVSGVKRLWIKEVKIES
jgi:hypothetical protein